MASGIIVNRGISGAWHDSAMSAASSTRNGRKSTRSPASVVSGTATIPSLPKSCVCESLNLAVRPNPWLSQLGLASGRVSVNL